MGRPQDVSTNVVAATAIIHSDEELKQKPHKWYYYLWDTLNKPKEERWFMFKLDAALLTFASMGVLLRISLLIRPLTVSQVTSSSILTR
jgi:ACS family pantothenate transporter-like MFS transporter